MSEEITPLEALEELKKRYGKNFSLNDDERCHIIETALKDYEHLCQIWNCKDSDTMIIQTTKTIHDENNKKLKALEIINKKNVDVLRIKITQNVERYNTHKIKGCRNLTQEEYDLLKEVLL